MLDSSLSPSSGEFFRVLRLHLFISTARGGLRQRNYIKLAGLNIEYFVHLGSNRGTEYMDVGEHPESFVHMHMGPLLAQRYFRALSPISSANRDALM